MIGDLAMKLHTGRSRNDQVVADVYLWIKEGLDSLELEVKKLITALVRRAEVEIDIIMPGYTHLQRAQPIRWSHLLLSYVCPLDRNLDRLKQLRARVDLCPLGRCLISAFRLRISVHEEFEKKIFHILYIKIFIALTGLNLILYLSSIQTVLIR